jgi:hypothetical protein
VCLTLSISGFLLKKFLLNKEDKKNFEENGIFGYIFVGFIALLINFFSPLSTFVNNTFILLIILFGFKFKFFEQKKINLFKKIILTSLIAYFFIIYSNVNRPDAFLYHLPYSKILTEDKIIIGLTNLHSRFGHISIYQYISSIHVNSLFSSNGVLIPISLVPSFFFVYCYRKFKSDFKNKNLRLNSYIVFLFLMISIYSFNRYSGWGNDAQAHIYYFLSIIYFLDNRFQKNNLNTFNKLMLTSLFTFLIKPFYLISFFMPLVFFILCKEKIKIIKSKVFIFLILFSLMWFLKNFLTSGCFIYPVNFSCIEKTSWYNENRTANAAIEGEGWAKDWGNRKKEYSALSFDEYVTNFNWLKTWSENHLKVVIEKTLPVIIFLIFNFVIFYLTKCLKKNNHKEKDSSLIFLFMINFLGCLIWFTEFPIYRYGSSYIYSFLILGLYFILSKKIDLDKIIKLRFIFTFIIFFGFFSIFAKNFIRVLNTENKSIYPIMFDKNLDGEVVKFYNKDGSFIHYRNEKGLCGFSKSPCRFINTEIKKDILFGYTIFR